MILIAVLVLVLAETGQQQEAEGSLDRYLVLNKGLPY